jgi:hypothetical protein
MRVHQAGSHLMHQRGAEVEDWSWQKTRRRLGLLWGLTRPYRRRTAFSVVSLLAATATALAHQVPAGLPDPHAALPLPLAAGGRAGTEPAPPPMKRVG